MNENYAHFEAIRERFVKAHANITVGKMMSSEAISYKGKIIAFYMSDDSMCFKLGRDYSLAEHGITEYRALSPFKNKAPMLDWLIISDAVKWDALTDVAVELMKAKLD